MWQFGYMWDDCGIRYRFEVRPLTPRSYGTAVVYGFLTAERRVLYLGKADILSERLSGHEKLGLAVRMGATELWVHEPGPFHLVSHEDAERRLIRAYAPILNKQHNPAAQLRGSISNLSGVGMTNPMSNAFGRGISPFGGTSYLSGLGPPRAERRARLGDTIR